MKGASMRVILLILSFVGLGCAVAYVHFDPTSSAQPITLPVPGEGLESAGGFDIPGGDRFILKLVIPAPPGPSPGSDASKRLACDLTVTVEEEGGRELLREHLQSAAYGFRLPREKSDYFDLMFLTIPHGGAYTLRVTNQGDTQIFQKRGGMVVLEQLSGSESFMLWQLVRLGVLFALPIGIIGTLLPRYRAPATA